MSVLHDLSNLGGELMPNNRVREVKKRRVSHQREAKCIGRAALVGLLEDELPDEVAPRLRDLQETFRLRVGSGQ
jgi:hypothetical protein